MFFYAIIRYYLISTASKLVDLFLFDLLRIIQLLKKMKYCEKWLYF